MTNKDRVIFYMTEFDKGEPGLIQHFMKVYEFSHLIAAGENLDADTQEILEVAAILHDIGIRPSLEKYGDASGRHQEEEGPACAQELLKKMNCYPKALIDRVCFLIGHHHTYTAVDGMDYQILIEADFLVNLFEDGSWQSAKETVDTVKKQIFKTKTGIWLLETLFF